MTNDFIGLAISYIYATSLLVIGEGLRRLFGVKAELTRKVIHISAGMWVFGVLLLFKHWEIGIIPFASFIGLNYLFYRYRIIGAMDTQDSSPGTVYFAISVTLLFGLLWRPEGPIDGAAIAVAGIMAMTWGDALAALIGRRFGQHKYQVGNSVRSWEEAQLQTSNSLLPTQGYFVLDINRPELKFRANSSSPLKWTKSLSSRL